MINFPKKLSCEYTNVKVINFIYNIVWANFALCSNYVRGRARPNIPCERKLTSENVLPRNGQNYRPRRGGARL